MRLCSVRVGNELGSGHPKSAAFSVVIVNTVSFIISVLASIIVLLLRDVISYAFTEGEAVAEAVSDLCPLLALTLLLNGVQPVLSGKFIYIRGGTMISKKLEFQPTYKCLFVTYVGIMKVWRLDADGKHL